MYDYKKQTINEIADSLKSYGYTVYLSKSKTHGFYTDGIRVVSFQYDFTVSFSGNYKSKNSGTGWRINEISSIPTQEQAKKWIEANPPHWATNGEQVKLTTPEEHLKMYGISSGYTIF